MSEQDTLAAERLKESKAKAMERLYKAGEIAGQTYVQRHADWEKLDRPACLPRPPGRRDRQYGGAIAAPRRVSVGAS